MYEIYCDEYLIYSDNLESLKITDTKLEIELNKTGSFEFTIYPNHPYYDELHKLQSIIYVYQDGEILFKGRIISDEMGFYNEKQVTCEGELAFLVDSIQRPYDFESGTNHTTVSELFAYFINNHNAQVNADRKFKVGNVTVSDSNNYIVRSSTEYENTWNSIGNKLIDSLGGYLNVRHEPDGVYIDYLSDFDSVATQTVKFGKNFLDINKISSGEDIVTAIIPLGASDSDTNEKLTIKSVNNGVDYVYNSAAVNAYGWIFDTVTWDDVTVASNLLTKAQNYIDTAANFSTTIELSAADLACLDKTVNSFKIGEYVNVFSIPHNINAQFLVSKLSIDLLNPTSNKLTLGNTYSSFTEQTASSGRETYTIKQTISEIKSTVDTIAGGTEARTTASLLNSWTNYGGDYEVASYWKDAQRTVHVAGLIASGTTTAGTTIFTLAEGYRPQAIERFVCGANNALCVLDIDTSGNVKIVSGASATWLSLSGITFRIA